VLRTFKTC